MGKTMRSRIGGEESEFSDRTKSSDRTSADHDARDSRSARPLDEHVIIQCPSCQTKFAVDRISVAHLSAARFHCSRCDHVFSHDIKLLPRRESAKSEKVSTDVDFPTDTYAPEHIEPEHIGGERERRAPHFSAPGVAIGGLSDSRLVASVHTENSENQMESGHDDQFPPPRDFEPDADAMGYADSSRGEWQLGTELSGGPDYGMDLGDERSPMTGSHLTERLPGSSSTNDFSAGSREEIADYQDGAFGAVAHSEFDPEVSPGMPSEAHQQSRIGSLPRTFSFSKSSAAPHEAALEDETQIAMDFGPRYARPPAGRPTARSNERAGIDAPMEFSLGGSPRQEFESPAPYIESRGGMLPSRAQPESSWEGTGVEDSTPELLAELRALRRNDSVSQWTGFFVVAVPLTFLVAALIGVSYLLRSDPHHAKDLFGGIFSAGTLIDAPEEVPPGLILENISFRRVVLESGETAYLIYGQVENQGSRPLRSVQIEGLGFDASGQVLNRDRTLLGTSLARAEIKGLNLEMIKDLQGRAPAAKFELKPGQTEPFAIALMGPDAGRAQYFSARVLTVKR